MSASKELYIPVTESFAQPSFSAAIISDPTQLMIDNGKRRMLELCGVDTEKLSDFELFSAWVENLPKMKGSGVYELFFAELEYFFGISDVFDLDICELWRRLCGIIEEKLFDKEQIIAASNVNNLPSAPLPRLSEAESFSELVNKNLEYIREIDNGDVILDLSDINFIRTDRYHAEQAYRAYVGGEKEGRDVFLSGLLYPIFEECKRLGLSVSVYVGERYTSLKKMTEYFLERGVLPSLRIFADDAIITRVASEICGKYGSRRILCGILYEDGDTTERIAERIKRISRVYPIGAIVAGGSHTTSPTFAARHIILERGIEIALK